MKVPPLKVVVGPALLAVAYYLCCWLGSMLRIPPATTSILWPPNALLTSALLLSPPRRWWIFLAAALPAHLLAEWQMGFPLPLVLALYLTNCSEALVGAGLVRRMSDAPARTDTLRRASIFLFAVVLVAPAVSGVLDAAAVSHLVGEPYARVWWTRFYSNTLAALTLVPVVLSLARISAWRPIKLGRPVEAALLVASLIGVATLVFGGPRADPNVPSWAAQPTMVLLLPLLLWAATRFGAAGSSLALLTTALLAFAAETSRVFALGPESGASIVHALQAFLLVTGIPLFGLGALIEERRSIEDELAQRLRFEGLRSLLSRAFVHLPSNAMGSAFESLLRQVGEFFGLDEIRLFQSPASGHELEVVATWSASGIPSAGSEGALALPLETGNTRLGMLVLIGRSDLRAEELTGQFLLVAEVFANALARKQGEDALRAGEEMKSSILASLSGQVAVLDRAGRIIAVNGRWARLLQLSGAPPDLEQGIGLHYFDACRRAGGAGLPAMADVMAVESVLDGTRPSFSLEYRSSTGLGERWFALTVEPLRRPEGGAVASHVDITERHHAEGDARRSREELAHFLRVSTVGELTASLAHELNQPLTAILANAQAARMRLDTGADTTELREILSDIIEEDQRAGDVIRRVRHLLRKGQPERGPLNANGLTGDMVRLVTSDAGLRSVSIHLDLAPGPLVVSGDRVQFQQVVLNLLLNGMDAVADRPSHERRIVVMTRSTPERMAQISVQDTGTGLPEGHEARVFEPFFTTKAAGMGMGLSIARSIVEAHGGRIWADNNPGRGATFTFSLPLA